MNSAGTAHATLTSALSVAQQRIWRRLVSHGPASGRVRYVTSIVGRLDDARFSRGVASVLSEHEVLRSRFAEPFGDGPHVESALQRIADDRHLFTLSASPLVADLTSLMMLARAMAARYAGQSGSASSDVLQYADFVAYEAEMRDAQHGRFARAYWASQLSGVSAAQVHALGRRVMRAAGDTARRQTCDFDVAFVSELHALASVWGCAIDDLALAAWRILLDRFTDERDTVIGYRCGGRGQDDLQAAVGVYERFVPLRLPVVRRWVDEVAKHASTLRQDAEEWQLGFSGDDGDVAAWDLDDGRFPIGFSWRDASWRVESGDAILTEAEAGGWRETCGLELVCEMAADGRLRATVMTQAAGDRPVSCERLLAQFAAALHSLVEQRETTAAALCVVGAEEARLLLALGTGAVTDRQARSARVHETIAAQGTRTPDAVAVVDGAQRLTFAALDAGANQIARYLRNLGAGPDVCVGVCVERSLEAIVALLGVLKSGAAYVPIDPASPAERSIAMIERARAIGVVTTRVLRERLAGFRGLVICLDECRPDIARESSSPLDARLSDDHLAYVMFTSGSTGEPKGVMVTHGGLANYLSWCAEAYGCSAGHGVALHSSLSFDLTVTSIFPALMAGKALIICRDRIDEMLSDADYTLTKVTPAHLELLAGTDAAPRRASGLTRAFVIGGEQLREDQLAFWRQHAPRTRLFNEYGPTETVVGGCVYESAAPGAAAVPIGRPIANTQVYVLDETGAPAPMGAVGELYIAGAGVARGYVHRPDLTAGRFLPVTIAGAAPGARWYRTGDRVRWEADGQLTFLGRLDGQVKLRGYRIELGDVEAAIGADATVGQVAVQLRPDPSPQLVAYVAPAPGQTLDLRALQATVRRRLPDYMMPGAWVSLARLPLTPHGKVDRRALPAPAPMAGPAGEAPRTAEEEIVAGIWADVLQIDRVARDADFFALGGHSLLATQVLSRVRDLLGVDLPLRVLFDAPTVAGVAAAVAASRIDTTAPVAPPLTRVTREGAVPLSFAQQRLWFLDQLVPDSPLYNVALAVALRGPLDVAALARSLDALVARHEVLRTSLPASAGQPVQVIAAAAHVPLPIVDLIALGASATTTARRLAAVEAARPFELSTGPLLRARLLRFAEAEHVVLLTLHHVVSDGWSVGVVVRELTALYAAIRAGEPSPLSPLPIQYADFAIWQRAWLAGPVWAQQMAYWRHQLAGVPDLALPTDFARPAIPTHRGAAVTVTVSPAITAAVRALSRREGVTVFMTLLAAFQVVLGRASGQTDFAVGTDVANRTRLETEALIGFFVNQLVLRTDLGGDPTFRELLRRVRTVTLDAYANQDVPFDHVVQELKAERDLRRAPLFQVKLVLQNAPAHDITSADLTASVLEIDDPVAKFDLTLILREEGDRLVGRAEYARDLFDRATIEQLLRRVERVLESAAVDPETRIGALRLLSDDERQQLARWNDTATPYPAEACIQALFRAQAQQHPDALAAVAEDASLTYEALDTRSNRVAQYLRDLGITAEGRVGLCLERGLELPIAMLGILKAGGAYVPLDPTHPAERIAQIIEDAQMSVVLTQASLCDRLPWRNTHVICLDDDWDEIAQSPPDDPAVATASNGLAYIIYTSGSTGRPKGTMAVHQGVTRLVRDTNYIRIQPADRIAHASTPAFDAATFEIWGALLNGAAMVCVDREAVLAPARLAAQLRRHAVGVMFLTTSLFQELVRADAECLRGPRCLIFGGEAADAQDVQRLLDIAPPAQLVNAYGPTETTTFAVCAQIPRLRPDAVSVPIGRPIANTTTCVVDAAGELAGAGVTGELHIGGPGLARGYLNDPALTAERFVPDPFSERSGARLYRTGDDVCWQRDGELMFIGRRDAQVKLRGNRIELTEIEARLKAHPAIVNAAVILVDDERATRHLVACVVAREDQAPRPAALRAFLEQTLPSYMIPARFHPIDHVPLTTTGKVDRRALAQIARSTGDVTTDHTPPSSDLERTLCEIWQEVLRAGTVGIHDNFFELGGDSILSIQIIARLHDYGWDVSVREMFEHQTIADLAAQLEPCGPASVATREYRSTVAALTPVQRQFLERHEETRHHFNQAVLLRSRAVFRPELLGPCLDIVVRQHPVLSSRFRRDGTQWVQVFDAAPDPATAAIIDLTALPESRRVSALERAAAQLQASLDIEQGPLLRVAAIRMARDRDGDGDGRVLFVLHHLIVDGVSWRILLEDLQAAYEAAWLRQRPRLLPEVTSFAQWCEALSAYAESETVQAEQAFWIAQHAAAVEMARDHETGPDTVASLGVCEAEFTEEETTILLRRVPRSSGGARVEDVLVMALAGTLAAWMDRDEVLIALESHGRQPIRSDLDLTRTIGWFTAIAPVAIRIDLASPPAAQLAQVAARLRAVPARGLGFGLLRSRALAHLSEADVCFNYLGQFDQLFGAGDGVFAPAEEAMGPVQSPRAWRDYVFEINALVYAGRLRLSWNYSRHRHRQDTVLRLLDGLCARVRAIVVEHGSR